MGLSIGNKEYFYIKDILENIIGIIDQEGNVVVYYRYDAYGNLSMIMNSVPIYGIITSQVKNINKAVKVAKKIMKYFI